MDLSKETVKRPYEVIVVVHPDTSVDEQKDLFKKNKATIEAYSGSLFSLETWGKRNLANPVGKLKKAIFFHSYFEASTQAITELERTIPINQKTLSSASSAPPR